MSLGVARFKFCQSPEAFVVFLTTLAPPITAVGLRLSDEAIRVALAHRLGCKPCEPHMCGCEKSTNGRGLHVLCCRRSATSQQRHTHLNDIIWTAIKRAQIPAVKDPVSLTIKAQMGPLFCRGMQRFQHISLT